MYWKQPPWRILRRQKKNFIPQGGWRPEILHAASFIIYDVQSHQGSIQESRLSSKTPWRMRRISSSSSSRDKSSLIFSYVTPPKSCRLHSRISSKSHQRTLCRHIWLELTRTYIPIRRMSPKHAHSRTYHAVIFYRNCTGFFGFGRKLIWDK